MTNYKPLSPKEEAQAREAELDAFLRKFQKLHPAPQADVEAVMYQEDGWAQWALINTIKSLPTLLIIALLALLLLVFDKTVSIFGRTHLLLPEFVVGLAGWLFMNFTLLVTSFGGELERIRSGSKPRRFTLLGLLRRVGEFIGIMEPEHQEGYSMAGFANLLLWIDCGASISAVWLSLGTKQFDTPEELLATGFLAFAVGAIGPIGIHKLGGLLASHGNRALQQEIERVSRDYRDAYNANFEAAWEAYWEKEGSRILHSTFVRRRNLAYHIDSPYLLLAGEEDEAIAAVPLAPLQTSFSSNGNGSHG